MAAFMTIQRGEREVEEDVVQDEKAEAERGWYFLISDNEVLGSGQ